MHEALTTQLSALIRAPVKTGDIGIELEYEGFHLPLAVTGWDVKMDGTLRGQEGEPAVEGRVDTPREYTMIRPVQLSSVRSKLNTLIKLLTTAPCNVVLTPRAGTHVHINMGTQTLRTLLGYILLFVTVEPVLLRLCGTERNGNSFCLPGYESGSWPYTVERMIQYLNYPYDYDWPDSGKYSALNIDSLLPLGSVEIRCFPNSLDVEQIHGWAESMLNLRTIAQASADDYSAVLNWINTSPDEFLTAVFGTANLHRACLPTQPLELLRYGQEEAYEVWRAIRPLFHPATLQVKKKKRVSRPNPEFQAVEVDFFDAPPGPVLPAPEPPVDQLALHRAAENLRPDWRVEPHPRVRAARDNN